MPEPTISQVVIVHLKDETGETHAFPISHPCWIETQQLARKHGLSPEELLTITLDLGLKQLLQQAKEQGLDVDDIEDN